MTRRSGGRLASAASLRSIYGFEADGCRGHIGGAKQRGQSARLVAQIVGNKGERDIRRPANTHVVVELQSFDIGVLWFQHISEYVSIGCRGYYKVIAVTAVLVNQRAIVNSRHLTICRTKLVEFGNRGCGLCGGSMVIVGGTGQFRGCAGHKDGGSAVCANAINVRKGLLESRLMALIKTDLLSAEVIRKIENRVAQRMAQKPKVPDATARIRALEDQVVNLTDAIVKGALKSSLSLAARLRAAEDELQRLTAETAKPKPTGHIVDSQASLQFDSKGSWRILKVISAVSRTERAQHCAKYAEKSRYCPISLVTTWSRNWV
jgi:hypothetical protein